MKIIMVLLREQIYIILSCEPRGALFNVAIRRAHRKQRRKLIRDTRVEWSKMSKYEKLALGAAFGRQQHLRPVLVRALRLKASKPPARSQ